MPQNLNYAKVRKGVIKKDPIQSYVAKQCWQCCTNLEILNFLSNFVWSWKITVLTVRKPSFKHNDSTEDKVNLTSQRVNLQTCSLVQQWVMSRKRLFNFVLYWFWFLNFSFFLPDNDKNNKKWSGNFKALAHYLHCSFKSLCKKPSRSNLTLGVLLKQHYKLHQPIRIAIWMQCNCFATYIMDKYYYSKM